MLRQRLINMVMCLSFDGAAGCCAIRWSRTFLDVHLR